ARTILLAQGFAAGEEVPSEVTSLALETARQLKHGLTDAELVQVTLPARGGGEVEFALSRAQLADLCEPLLERTGQACRRALRDAELGAGELDGVILVGGSTRMPAVRQYVEALFGRPPLVDLDPELVVAY